MFSKMLIFLICFIGFFTLTFALIPSDFFAYQSVTSSAGVDPVIEETYSLANVTIYNNLGNDTMTYDYSSLDDHWSGSSEYSAGLPSGQYFEVWWGWYGAGGAQLQFRHTTVTWYRDTHILTIYEDDDITQIDPDYGYYLDRQRLIDHYNSETNTSNFYTNCEHIQNSVLINYNQSKYTDIGNAWDSGELNYIISYEIDWNATSMSALTVLGRLMTFQTPDLGFQNTTLNAMCNALIALPLWTMIVILIIKLVQSVLPTVPGVQE